MCNVIFFFGISSNSWDVSQFRWQVVGSMSLLVKQFIIVFLEFSHAIDCKLPTKYFHVVISCPVEQDKGVGAIVAVWEGC